MVGRERPSSHRNRHWSGLSQPRRFSISGVRNELPPFPHLGKSAVWTRSHGDQNCTMPVYRRDKSHLRTGRKMKLRNLQGNCGNQSRKRSSNDRPESLHCKWIVTILATGATCNDLEPTLSTSQQSTFTRAIGWSS